MTRAELIPAGADPVWQPNAPLLIYLPDGRSLWLMNPSSLERILASLLRSGCPLSTGPQELRSCLFG